MPTTTSNVVAAPLASSDSLVICSYNPGESKCVFPCVPMISLLQKDWTKRHWRGDLPLPLSFWGVGVIGIAFLFLWARLIDPSFLDTYDPYLNLFGLSARYVVTLVTLTWWLVGAWRSATARALRPLGSIWAKLTKLAICVVILREIYILPFAVVPIFADAVSNINEDPKWGPRGVRAEQGTTELEVYGAITRSVPRALELALRSNPKLSIVRLDSKGGRADAAYELRSIISSHGLDTLVSTECSSFCVIAFLSGKHRWMEHNARIGFHSTSFGGQRASDANKIAIQEMEVAGVSKTFLQKAFATPPDSVWYPSFDELKDAGVVTDVFLRAQPAP